MPQNARATLLDISGPILTAYDGLTRFAFTWSDIRHISASYGRQHYDMTRCLDIVQRRGIDLFLPENENLWPAFSAGIEHHLGAVPEADWSAWLANNPEGTTTIYRRRRTLPFWPFRRALS